MSISKVWKTKTNTVTDDVIQFCGGNKVLAILLKNRGIDSVDKIRDFLNPLKARLSSPDVFSQMQKTVERIKLAVQNNEHITVYGDFDADGVTATALLYLTLKEIGASVDYYLPNRATESHGLNTKALVKIISKRRARLIITVDCGISNVPEVNFANGFKTDIIITDHHEAPEVLPDAFSILNPKAPNSIDSSLEVQELQSLNYLCGVGVAFKLACRLLEIFKKESFVNEILPIVAVGTIGDVVELLGENRSLVSMGIELIKAGKHKGIQKLLKSAGIEDVGSITSENIAFGIVPRINAAGRLESPDTAIKVLISDDDIELDNTISDLNDLNVLRQQLCDEVFNTANQMYQKDLHNNKKSIILFNENWHIGVIGIVASKLLEIYNKPVFLMTKDANIPNLIRCSCRSIDGINVHSVLSNHSDLFEGFGGHKLAAGFSFDETKISFDSFKVLLNKTIDEFSQNVDFKQVVVYADMEISPDDINQETIELIEKLQPFGAANPSPLFILNDLMLNNYRMMGKNNSHLKLNLQKEKFSFDCVKWNCPDFKMSSGQNLDILFSMKLNVFNGNTSIQLMLEDIHSEFLTSNVCPNDIKILDHRNKKNIVSQVLDFIISTKKTTAIYMENQALLKQLNLPEQLIEKVFSSENIPVDVEQLMFFEAPPSSVIFSKILNETNAKIIHLMNFSVSEVSTDVYVTKLFGMLKYAISNLSGIVNLNRAAKALCVSNDMIECSLTLFSEAGMIDLEKEDDENFRIMNFNPIELFKIKQSDIYTDLEEQLNIINSFKKFYLNSSIEDIKEVILC